MPSLARGAARIDRDASHDLLRDDARQILEREEDDESRHATRLTSRAGTTITFFGSAPSSTRITLALARAAASITPLSLPFGMTSVSSNLPLTWIAIVTSSSISSAGS